MLHATISDTDEGIEAEIELSTSSESDAGVGAGTTLALCSDTDRLLVNGFETEEVYALGHLFYTVELSEPSSHYEVTLDRRDRQDVSVTVEAPPSFDLDEPVAGAEHSRGLPLEVKWSPAWPERTSELSVADEIGSGCIEGLGVDFTIDDTGSYVVGAGTLESETGGSCEVKVSLTRINEADYPSSLAEGGSITAIVKRRRAFTSVE